MKLHSIWKSFFTVATVGCGIVAGAAENEIVEMWKCPMPQKNVKGAGYPDIPGIVHADIFKATPETGGYNHHTKIINFNNKFYAMWSNQRYGEDGPGQKILYSTSPDGKKWAPYKVLVGSMHKEQPWGNTGINLSANAWVVSDGKLYAKVWCGQTVAWADRNQTETVKKHSRKFCFAVRERYPFLFREVKADGTLGPLACYNPNKIPQDTLIKVVDAGKVYPGLKDKEKMQNIGKVIKQSGRRLCEPALFTDTDGNSVLLFRDDNYSHRKWVSYSKDGKNWTSAKPTNVPDSPSATTAMTLDNGTVLLVGNHMAYEFDKDKPRHYGRDPLTLSVSKDGKEFTSTYAVRSGDHKFTIPREVVRGRGGGAQYPDMIKVGNTIYIIYSYGKEDICVSSFPLSAIGVK